MRYSIVASAATLWWNGFRRFGKEVFDPKLYALVVIDEAQEAVTEKYFDLSAFIMGATGLTFQLSSPSSSIQPGYKASCRDSLSP